MRIVVGGHYYTRGGGARVVHITQVVYGNEATPPVPDEYQGWTELMRGGVMPDCNKKGGWVSAWHEDGTSTCNPSLDCVSWYPGPYTRFGLTAIGRMNVQEVG